ncbi:3'-5' exonuclease [Vibrio sp. SS-MA-C1-2]|uniref:3'-5' exonuclease n=1 Tax=Vibrio sp. SS-MA-C1-2 TaxID=2908646 RepID=UPI001F3B2F0E|nr:3'-5' exonuclease [Vibrio sp. SS-MA-C1-2]UJF16883.1 3'-5' exonuclease [Vibrio sp. SS-MA-C1-2]
MLKGLFRRKNPELSWSKLFEDRCIEAVDPRLQHFYHCGVIDPETPLNQVPFVALDFETTGLDSDQDDIVSIGLIPFDLNRIYCRESAHWLVNPNTPLEEESVVIHGITHSDISDAPDLRRVLEQVLDALAGKIVVVHYRHIERDFLNSALLERVGEGITFPVVDTMDLEAKVQERLTGGLLNKLRRRRPASIRLANSRERYGLPVYQPHHALVDAIATAELLQAQIAYHYTPETPIKDIWR